MLDIFHIKLITNPFSPGIHHGQKRHTPIPAALGDSPQNPEHPAIGRSAQVNLDRYRVSAQTDRFLHRADHNLVIRIGTQDRAGGEVNNQPYVFTFSPVTGLNHSLVHKNRVGAAFNYPGDCRTHIRQPRDRSQGNTVIHRNNNSAAGVPVHDSFHANLFTNHFLSPP